MDSFIPRGRPFNNRTQILNPMQTAHKILFIMRRIFCFHPTPAAIPVQTELNFSRYRRHYP